MVLFMYNKDNPINVCKKSDSIIFVREIFFREIYSIESELGMKKKFVVTSCLIVVTLLSFNNVLNAQARVKEATKFSEKIFFGGSIGMVFGSVTQIDILPEVGMWVIPQWSIGVGGRYTFRKERSNIIDNIKPYTAHIWGLSGFTEILPIPDLDKAFKIGIHGGPIFHGEWEGLYLDKGMLDPTAGSNKGKGWVHLFLVGAGYRFPIGDKAAINLLAMWNITDSRYSPYASNPMFRISVNF